MPDNPLIAALKSFREMQFFADRAGMSDMDLAVQLGYDVTLPHDTWGPRDDAMLLANDGERAWWDDSAAGVAPGARVYEKILSEWAGISRGALALDAAAEFWAAAEGPVWIKLVANGRSDRLHPAALAGGRLDFTILNDLNRLLKSRAMEFCLLEPDGAMALLVALTPAEKRRLARERGWTFTPPSRFYTKKM